MRKKLTSILLCAIFVASFNLVPKKAEARWLAAMDVELIRENQASSSSVDVSAEVGPGSGGGSVGSSSSDSNNGRVLGVFYECKFALASCDTERQRFVELK